MHQDPWEPLDGPFSSERKPNPDSSDADLPAEGESSRISSPLLNWQVVEIEGEATLIEETEIKDASSTAIHVTSPQADRDAAVLPLGPRSSAAIREQIDDIVVAGMRTRRIVVMPGEEATFEVSVANLGRWSALFEVALEGWIDEAWTPDLPLRVQLEPGARQVVTVTLVPPRQSSCHAGEHALAVVVRAARYPGHVTRMAATLIIERFAAVRLGTPQPRELALSWFMPVATVRLPMTNQSNYPATIHLQGVDRERQCDFTFYVDGYVDGHTRSGIADGLVGAVQIVLEPGQTVAVPVEIRTRQRPIIGLAPRITSFRLVARVDTDPPLRRAVDGQLVSSALIGPWQMAIAAVLGVMAILGTGLAGLALLVALRSANPVMPAAPVASAPVEAAPVVALVIQMDQPMPTRIPDRLANAAPAEAPLPGAAVASEPPVIPVIRADQVTAPGQPTPVGQTPLRPLVVTTPGAGSGTAAAQGAAPAPVRADQAALTYGQMFQQVALQYDLDWRLLAAQAYLESGFDSLALSGDGDMGLMQIRPGTWNEWAPTVDASDPFDSYSNVLVGAVYLNHLREQLSEQGQSRQEWMLVAYNWGPDKVLAHLSAGGTWESLDPARRQYAEDVLRIAASIPPS
ncbi:MAG: transglycosylase SLT domain-containing protein [Caldilineaceae bacterium]|nr:transglycosylase SLT domain-containing protein [Caldilineaceae bacterium]